ncbi:MAG: GNAT family N-acetyltransferase [Bacteriovorax sp.]|nr:GNAT family N-acetyltransferase [Bacteriovorax sp.]
MLEIRKVLEEDKEIIIEWRNDPRVYKYALNPNPVSVENHEKWFGKVLSSNTCFFYMGIYDGKKCGTVRYDLLDNNHEAEVSISLAPDFWGKGLAFLLMNLGEAKLKLDSQVKVIHATVLNENTASMSLFVKSDFHPYLTKLKKEI